METRNYICEECGLDCEDELMYKKHKEIAENKRMQLYVKQLPKSCVKCDFYIVGDLDRAMCAISGNPFYNTILERESGRGNKSSNFNSCWHCPLKILEKKVKVEKAKKVKMVMVLQ